MNRPTKTVFLHYGGAMVVTALAVCLRLLLDPLLGDRFPFLTLFAAVAFAAWFGGRGPALLAIVAGAFAAAYFFFRPIYSFSIDQPEDRFGLVLYLVVDLAVMVFFESLRKAQKLAEEKQQQLEQQIAARHAAEQVLAEREELLRITLDSIGEAVITTDPSGNITYLNAQAQKLTGWMQLEAVGKPLSEVLKIVNEKSRQPLQNPIEKAMREGCIVGLTNHTLLIARDGGERPIEESTAPIRDKEGGIAGGVLLFRDCTERRRAELADQRNKEVLKLVHQIGKIGFWEWNSLTDENKWSPEMEELYGLAPGGFEGGYAGWAKLLHPNDLPKAEAHVRRALVTGEFFTEFRVVWPDGSIHWLETRANVLKDDHGNAVRMTGVNMDLLLLPLRSPPSPLLLSLDIPKGFSGDLPPYSSAVLPHPVAKKDFL